MSLLYPILRCCQHRLSTKTANCDVTAAGKCSAAWDYRAYPRSGCGSGASSSGKAVDHIVHTSDVSEHIRTQYCGMGERSLHRHEILIARSIVGEGNRKAPVVSGAFELFRFDFSSRLTL